MDDSHAFPMIVSPTQQGSMSSSVELNLPRQRVSPSSIVPIIEFPLVDMQPHVEQATFRPNDPAHLEQENRSVCFCLKSAFLRLWFHSFWLCWIALNLLSWLDNPNASLFTIVASIAHIPLEALRLAYIGPWKLDTPCHVVRRPRCFRAHSSLIYLSGMMDVLSCAASVWIATGSHWSIPLVIFFLARLAYLCMSLVISACAQE